ncbi:hypothetical protein EVAR_792_1 [Eumeta japonica]|uniref:Uncharacterized protein n=1 Tax=Eumeta variegata TaxID=151549 RepID=A0A4C1SC65_EUMVA|nr:hypothetical protein EVAR_792_1 [Eumeta japonica]
MISPADLEVAIAIYMTFAKTQGERTLHAAGVIADVSAPRTARMLGVRSDSPTSTKRFFKRIITACYIKIITVVVYAAHTCVPNSGPSGDCVPLMGSFASVRNVYVSNNISACISLRPRIGESVDRIGTSEGPPRWQVRINYRIALALARGSTLLDKMKIAIEPNRIRITDPFSTSTAMFFLT